MTNPRKKCGLILLIIGAMLLVHGVGHAQDTTQQESGLAVETAAICEGVENRELVNPGASFSSSINRLYCFSKIVGAAGPVQVTHVWYFGDVERARISLAVKDAAWRTFSSKMIRSQEIGAWRVEILGPDGAVLEKVPFEVVQ
jgi:hypothetical protein